MWMILLLYIQHTLCFFTNLINVVVWIVCMNYTCMEIQYSYFHIQVKLQKNEKYIWHGFGWSLISYGLFHEQSFYNIHIWNDHYTSSVCMKCYKHMPWTSMMHAKTAGQMNYAYKIHVMHAHTAGHDVPYHIIYTPIIYFCAVT